MVLSLESKALTRKERVETQKATARIKADQQVSLSRTTQKELTLSNLFQQLSSVHFIHKYNILLIGELSRAKVAEEPADPVSESSQSDPIQQFSSPVHTEHVAKPFVPRSSSLRPGLPLRARSNTAELEFVSTGLLAPSTSSSRASSSKPPIRRLRTPSPSRNMFVSNGLLGESSRLADDSSEDDVEMPNVASLLDQDMRKREAEEQRRKMREAKMRFVQSRQPAQVDDDSDIEIIDNDMRVIANEEEKDRRAAKIRNIRPSIGRKNQLSLAGRSTLQSPTKVSPIRRPGEGLESLKFAAVPAFSVEARAEARRGKERASNMNPRSLNEILLGESENQKKALILQKEQEFYRRQGLPRDRMPTDEDLEIAKRKKLQAIIRKGALAAQKREEDNVDEEEHDEDSDGEWIPNEIQERPELEDDEADENLMPNELPVASSEDDRSEHEEVHLRHRGPRKSVMVLDSDDENDPRLVIESTGRVLVPNSSSFSLEDTPYRATHRASVSSLSDRLEEGTDKENDIRLMYDRGEDKENTSVATPTALALSPLGSRSGRGSLFLSEASGSQIPATQDNERTPFKEIPQDDDEDPFFSSPTRPPRIARATTPLHAATSTPRRPIESSGATQVQSDGLAEFFEPTLQIDKGKGRAIEGDQPCLLEPAAVIDSGESGSFSEFFAPTLKNSVLASSKPGNSGFSQFFTPAKVSVLRADR